MAKTVDITEKLSFDSNPFLVVKGTRLEVRSDAKTMLEIMGIFADGGNEMNMTIQAYKKLFSEEDRRKLEDMKLPFQDFLQITEEAMLLAQGGDDSPGEQ